MTSLSASGQVTASRSEARTARAPDKVSENVPAVQREKLQAQGVASDGADGARHRLVPVSQPVRFLDIPHRQPTAAPDGVQPAKRQMAGETRDVFAVVHAG